MKRIPYQQTKYLLRRGFTLIELMLVVGGIGILAGIVIVSINPAKQLADARNEQRRADIHTIANALYQYSLDHDGSFPSSITTIETELCRSGINIDCTGLINLNALTGAYLHALPTDPTDATESSTSYTIQKMWGQILVRAPAAEFGEVISVIR